MGRETGRQVKGKNMGRTTNAEDLLKSYMEAYYHRHIINTYIAERNLSGVTIEGGRQCPN